MLTLGKFSVFSLTTLMLVNSVALKTQFSLKWTGLDIVKKKYSV